MPKKIIETEESRKATENLRPFFEAQEKWIKEGFPARISSESPYLKFLEPLWGRTPRHVSRPYGEFVIGEIIYPGEMEEELDNSDREGIWNAATGELVFKRRGAVSVCWSPDHSQIGVWHESLKPIPNEERRTRGDYLWEFERYSWETKELISSCKVVNEGYMWSIYVDFPKKYKGAIARFYGGSEDGGESLYLLCDDQAGGDRELSDEEMEPWRKSKTFDIKRFWEEIRNPKIPEPSENLLFKVTGERKNDLVREVENHVGFNHNKYEQIAKWYKDIPTVVDWTILHNWSFPTIVTHVTMQIVFTWKNPKNKGVIVKVIFKSRKTDIEFIRKSTGERIIKELNENDLSAFLKELNQL